MAQMINNPWSFTSADPATAAITAVTGLTLNANGTVAITSGALTFNATADSALAFTVLGAAAAAYNGFYTLQVGVSGGTAFTMIPNFVIPVGTAQSGGGTLAQVVYRNRVRIEDISWQNASAAGQLLDLRDRNGNPIWQATATAAGSQNRGKIFWVSGITPITIQSGIILVTVN